ncbi:RNA-directed RNA polymerase 2 [Panaeolus papilionaceus]|nr:RNA-directed RNA polymerase 2 [Panaeolus papilionaceus]
MELFMRNVPPNITTTQLTLSLATVLHGHLFQHLSETPVNFHVYLFPDKRNAIQRNSGLGALTLPSEAYGRLFLDYHQRGQIRFNTNILFSISRKPPREDILREILDLPYVNPGVAEERRRRTERLDQEHILINELQFCWMCRDGTLSVELEEECAGRCLLRFDNERREIRVEIIFNDHPGTYRIAMPYANVNYANAHWYARTQTVIIFDLNSPPKYEVSYEGQSQRQRLSSLPIPGHATVAPYASVMIRVVCRSTAELDHFHDLAQTAQFNNLGDEETPIDKDRRIFAESSLDRFQAYLHKFNWRVAFQLEGLLRSLTVDVREILRLLPRVRAVVKSKGKEFASQLLRRFRDELHKAWVANEDIDQIALLASLEGELDKGDTLDSLVPLEGNYYHAYTVLIGPTTMRLQGPTIEQSNRVIRSYDTENHDSFLRVSFVDEVDLRYRFDREIDGAAFIRNRIGPILKEGLHIAGRKFEFLAYSQSALKEHSVWFVKGFRDPTQGYIDARKIIQSLGDFSLRDQDLVRCPARYAARLSQAFTATDAVNVVVDSVREVGDIEVETNGRKYQFTDGVGTISDELAREMWAQLKAVKKKGRSRVPHPKAYQIRFKGSKGMLSVDHELRGLVMTLRPSMIKFEAPEDMNVIEIARAFDRPGEYFLNRPLIMLMEGLGVPYSTFKTYQDRAVEQTRNATRSLEEAADLMASYGLGTAYRIPSILHHLAKQPMYLESLPNNQFYQKMLTFSVNHALRMLKNKASIPIPGAWTLVGVADVHSYLKPNEIFAHVRTIDGKSTYLDGPVLISRSPTIHPGDVRIVHAIGRPPRGSCFEVESLRNTVVFSVQGNRPVPSCLGGGDLDGDVYNLISLKDLPEFTPTRQNEPPAEYKPAPKKTLDRPSTMDDVADFVMEFIHSDVVGIVATNWLIIADQSTEGIFDRDCIQLAQIHSDAVDYPKSGKPVAVERIPKLKRKSKPDWNAPETVDINKSDYYISHRAIGKLFRAIDLPIEHPGPRNSRRQRQVRRERGVEELSRRMANLDVDDNDILFHTVEERVQDFMDTDEVPSADNTNDIARIFRRYSNELQAICSTTTLSNHRRHTLSEEEAVVGTIVEKSSQPRRRKELMSTLREKTTRLVEGAREALEGDDSVNVDGWLQRSWVAFQLAKANQTQFGAQSFGWVALGSILDAVTEIKAEMEN